ncbi:DUF2911 domain-containing protein [Roseisolibacter sp. H3M3-2]|uniref:DUF2911 domain-containing protein n=1 Tax=Roseisolibacter sp. H3M3-2 TaxID=3031323 RepID=UPI0023D99949|nr:DUF2911 domain-containing protein [Roseisolibacter sp. H3M3-2]MDF1504724.1 DUF2911 domain-containing protein [Roseisolibacter sp. H3M3-2]
MRPTTFLLAPLAGALLAAPAAAQTGALRAAPSTRATAEVVLTLADTAAARVAGPSKIRIDYGQPHLRGRRLHTDSLVPYDRLWRTGANDPTTLTTDVDLTIGGTAVPKGSYVVQSMPARAGWQLVLQKPPAAQGGQPTDVARIPLRAVTLPQAVESLTFWLIPSTQPGAARGELRFAWGTTALAADWQVR